MATPEQVDVWVGLDVGKEEHFAEVLDNDGDRLFAVSLRNDQAALEAVLERASGHGVPALAIDQPGSIAQLALAVARQQGVPVAYIPGLVMRRAADLYPGEAKTDRRDAYVIADTARTRRKQVHWHGHRLRRTARTASGTQRVRHRPGRRSDPPDQPAPRRLVEHLARSGTSPGFSGSAWRGPGPAGQISDPDLLQGGGERTYRADDQDPLASPRRQGG